MAGFLGEYPCSIDNKGRVKLPAALKKQLDPAINGRFVVNRGFEKCLVLYPYDEWEKITARVNQLNTFNKQNREFVRYFYRGATELVLDSADRILLPKHLLEYGNIQNELLLAARINVIEIWNPQNYEKLMSMDSEQFEDLAERVMGDKNLNDDPS
ncbi:MAG: transcriptional regulator MraZ [Chitinophagales bacterium]|nr:MAG: transcriptional regulator MraZ [Chitinophagales bacterium]